MKKIKLIRTYGPLPALTKKISNRENPPGQHGVSQTKKKQSQYSIRLIEKQKVRLNYALSEKQFVRYVNQAKRSSELTGSALLHLLENRLDTSIYREGFAPTILAARQLVTHKHISVNGKIINIPSYQCKNGDELQTQRKLPSEKVKVILNRTQINRPMIELNVQERLVVEYYSRK